jgi:S-DNA-T family DNA segregation ATPase FtsK/SpoIIIE
LLESIICIRKFRTEGDKTEKELEELVTGLFKMIGNLLKSLYFGIKKLKNKNCLISFICFCIFPIVTVKLQYIKNIIFSIDTPVYIQYLVYYFLILLPIIYLVILGKLQDKNKDKYTKIFKEIGFSGQDKNYPFFIGTRAAGKKIIYYFKSNIPIQEWKKAIDRLENGLDCNILMIHEGKSKKIVELTTVPSSCRIPDKIDWSDEFISPDDGVMVVGEGALEKIKFDLNRVPHVLSAGETGSGKSVLLRLCLWQMIKKGCLVYMFDFKGGVEFGKQYEQFGEVITDRERALEVLKELSLENSRRLNLFRNLEVKNLKQYNKKTGENLQRIGVFCDEIGEMMDKKGAAKLDKAIMEQLEGIISSLARLSRATGINIFLGVQRPDANVLTGQIKNNIPVRISGRFADKPASEIVLGNSMAVDLPDIKGRFLIKIGNEFTQFQAYYFDDDTMLDSSPGELNQENKTNKVAVTKRKKQVQDKKEPVKQKVKSAKVGTDAKELDGNNQSDQIEIDFDEKILWEPDLKKKEIELDFDYSKFD